MSRVPAPIRRPSSSRRGWLAHQERAVAPLALRGSEFDPPPGSTWMQFTRRLKTAFTCSSGLAPLRLWGHPRSAWQGRTREGVFTTSNSSIRDAERFAQVCSYQCS